MKRIALIMLLSFILTATVYADGYVKGNLLIHTTEALYVNEREPQLSTNKDWFNVLIPTYHISDLRQLVKIISHRIWIISIVKRNKMQEMKQILDIFWINKNFCFILVLTFNFLKWGKERTDEEHNYYLDCINYVYSHYTN